MTSRLHFGLARVVVVLIALGGGTFLSRPAHAQDAPLPSSATAEGTNAPPASSDGAALRIKPLAEIFGEYRVTSYDAPATEHSWFHELDVPRVHLGLEAAMDCVTGRVLVEAVRSADEGALLGVAGDSLVMRVREASAAWDVLSRGLVTTRIGAIRTLTPAALERIALHRVLAPTALERYDLAAPADLGASAELTLPAGYGAVAVGAYDGEGIARRELNRGKNLEGFAWLRPFAASPVLRPWSLLASYVAGSQGTASTRHDRLTTALAWDDVRIGGYVALSLAWGIDDIGVLRGRALDVAVHAEPWKRVLLAARLSHFLRDTTQPEGWLLDVDLGAGYRIAAPLEVFVALDRRWAGAAARGVQPEVERTQVRVIARLVVP